MLNSANRTIEVFNQTKNIIYNIKLTSEKKVEQISKKIEQNKELLDFKGESGNTLLHYAAIAEVKEVYEMLVNSGASVNVKNNRDKTPEDLIKLTSEANDRSKNKQQTPIRDIIQINADSRSRKNAVDENICNSIYS